MGPGSQSGAPMPSEHSESAVFSDSPALAALFLRETNTDLSLQYVCAWPQLFAYPDLPTPAKNRTGLVSGRDHGLATLTAILQWQTQGDHGPSTSSFEEKSQ